MFNDSTVFKAMQHVEYAKNMWYVSIASEIEGKPPSETVNFSSDIADALTGSQRETATRALAGNSRTQKSRVVRFPLAMGAQNQKKKQWFGCKDREVF